MSVAVRVRRRVGPGLLFAAVAGGRLYRRTVGRRVRVVAVVGSVGKTTTTRAVAAALGAPIGRVAQMNANTPVGVGRALLGARPWHRHAVIEAAINGPGQMRRQAQMIQPDIAVVTAIASDHWKSFSTLEQTRDEKAEMLRALPRTGVAVVNADDPNVRWMATQTKARVVLVGEAPDADVRVTDIALDWPHGTRFNAHIDGRVVPVTTRLLGRHMVFPALAALAVANVEGVPLERAVAALANLQPTFSRMQLVPLENGAFVIRDDYKASLESIAAAAETLAQIPARRRIVVLGALSEARGRQDFRDAGATLGAAADRVVLVGPSGDMQPYRSGLARGGVARENVQRVHNAREAAELLGPELRDGDVVLTKGRQQQALARVALALSGRDVQCRADPCPFKRMVCDLCPYLEQPFDGRKVSPLAQPRS